MSSQWHAHIPEPITKLVPCWGLSLSWHSLGPFTEVTCQVTSRLLTHAGQVSRSLEKEWKQVLFR